MAVVNDDLRIAMEQMSGRQAWPQQLGAIETMRAARPVGSPVEGGTHTQRRLEADESSRQFGEQMNLQRAQMALQERLARMQMSAAASARRAQEDAMAAAQQRRQDEVDSINALVRTALTKGPDALKYIDQILWENRGKFEDVNQARAEAMGMFKSFGYEPWGDPRQIEKTGADRTPLSVGPATQQFFPRLAEGIQGMQPMWDQVPQYHAPLPSGEVFGQSWLQQFPESATYQHPVTKEPPPMWIDHPNAPPPEDKKKSSWLDIFYNPSPSLNTSRGAR